MSGAAFNRGKSKQNYATPLNFINAVRKKFDIADFDIDLAADDDNAKALTYFTEADDSLSFHWDFPGKHLWLNPPFGDIRPWVDHASLAVCASLFVLIPASVGSNWYRDFVHRKALVYFLNGRIPFDPDNPKWGFPKDCMLCVYGDWINLDTSGGPFDVWDWKKSLDNSSNTAVI